MEPQNIHNGKIDHGFISNGYGAALISSKASIDWLTLPRFDSPPLFLSLLDERMDYSFRISFGEGVTFKRGYVSGSLILETHAESESGLARIRDLMPQSESSFMRYIKSTMPFSVSIRPAFEYGLINPSFYLKDGGAIFGDPTGKQAFEIKFRWSSRVTNTGRGEWNFEKGSGYILMLYTNDVGYGLFSKKGGVYSIPKEAMKSTIEYWATTKSCCPFEPPSWAKKAFDASLLVALGLIYRPSGAIIAAPTTSLPEIVRSNRNWDYRYAWIRDASFAAKALLKAGFIIKGREILNFLLSVLDPSRKPFNHTLYTVDGGPPPSEKALDWLSGYRGSRPVRVGNAAHLQIQLDIEGEFMKALETYYDLTKDREYLLNNWWAVESIARFTAKSYKMADAGIWEERDRGRHYTHSKVMMWNALNVASKLAIELEKVKQYNRWKPKAELVRDYILKNSWDDEARSFVRSFGSKEVDASLLVMPLYGFVEVNDERFKLTLKRIEDELVSDYMVFRYRKDFLGKTRHPFGLANSWMARVKIMQGEREEALKYITRLISCSNDLGLLGEHTDMKTCEPRGNYPQLFTHIGIIEAVIDIQNAKPPQ
ncbi:MAG: glycoside hydrolase family 15 protein [Conexivisphaerales archaeon]